MATFPPVHDAERDAALARIAARHERAEDPRWSEAGTEARDILSYLRRRHERLPGDVVAQQDVWDELVLSAWVFWDERRRERELLTRAHRCYGLSLSELGRFVGISSRQGMQEYLDRLEALLHEAAPSSGRGASASTSGDDPARFQPARGLASSYARNTRAERGADAASVRARRSTARFRSSRAAWINAQRPRIEGLLRELLEQAGRIGIAASSSDDDEPVNVGDYLSWIADDLNSHDVHAATLDTLGMALGELRHHPAVRGRAANHGIHQTMRTADHLRSSYAELLAQRPAGKEDVG